MRHKKTTLSESIEIVESKEKYDAACKKMLAEKIILAWIMKYTMSEYREYEVQEIVENYILGEPKVSKTRVLPDETNAPKITGVEVGDASLTEGSVTYDIQFRALLPEPGEVVQMIINIEAQNDFYPGYPLIKRGIYYCGRMISSQYGTVFVDSHYEKIQKVYSIWICMNPPKGRRNTITEYSLTEKNHVGAVKETKEHYDLISAIMICLGGSDGDEADLLSLLDVLLTFEKSASEKKEILEKKYHIPMTREFEGEVEHMCNLSDNVEMHAIEKGMQRGLEKSQRMIIKNMLNANEPIVKICLYTQCDEDYVLKIKEDLAQSN